MLLVLAAQHGWFGPGRASHLRRRPRRSSGGPGGPWGGGRPRRRAWRRRVRTGRPRRHRCGRGLPRRGRRDQWLRLGGPGGRTLARRRGRARWSAPCAALGQRAAGRAHGARRRDAGTVRRAGRGLGGLGIPRGALRGRMVGRRVATRPALTVVRTVPVTFSLLVGAVTEAGTGPGAVGHVAVAAVVLAVTLATSTISVRRDAHDVSASMAVALLAVGLLATSVDARRAPAHAGAGRPRPHPAPRRDQPRPGRRSARSPGTWSARWALPARCAPCSPCCPALRSGSSPPACCCSPSPGSPRPGSSRSRTSLALAPASRSSPCSAGRSTRWPPSRHPPPGRTTWSVALLDSILVAAVVATGLWAVGAQRGLGRDVRLTATVVAWVLGLGASTTVSSPSAPCSGPRRATPVLGFTIGHAVATVTWMLAAAWLLLRGLEHSRDADLTLRTGPACWPGSASPSSSSSTSRH